MEYVRGDDVLDIWFDSGVSWASVLTGQFFIFFFSASYVQGAVKTYHNENYCFSEITRYFCYKHFPLLSCRLK